MTNTPTRPTPIDDVTASAGRRGTSRLRRPTRSRLLAQLDREWLHLRTSRRAVLTARSWAHDASSDRLAEVVTDLTDLDEILSATQRSHHPDRPDDAVLLALVGLSQRGDELAGRVVLQHLLPALVGRSRRYRSFHDRSDPAELAVAAAWLAIRGYDVEHRRRHVASSLLSDAVFQAFRRPLRRRSATEEVRAPGGFVRTPSNGAAPSGLEELATTLREASDAGVPREDLDLLRELVRVESACVVASEREVTTRTIRNHRNRAIERVRAALEVAA